MEGTRLPWEPGLERTQLLIGLAVEIQVTSVAEGKWTGGSGAAVLEERAAAVEVRLSVEAEIPEAGGGHLEGTCRHEELHMVGNKQRAICMQEWVLIRGRLFRVASCRRMGGNLSYRPKTDVMPLSLELSIPLLPSVLKKLCHSPQRECAVLTQCALNVLYSPCN